MTDHGKKITRMDYLRMTGMSFLWAGIAAASAGFACSGGEPGKKSCAECTIRKSYDKDQTSLLARTWKWHIKYCPGWKAYIGSLPEQERKLIEERYR